jgi:hypothetical protein
MAKRRRAQVFGIGEFGSADLTSEEGKRRQRQQERVSRLAVLSAKFGDSPELDAAIRAQAEAVSPQRRASERMAAGMSSFPLDTEGKPALPAGHKIRMMGDEYWLQSPGPGLMMRKIATEYAPRDKQRIEKLYRERSDIVVNPEIDEHVRQEMVDEKDRQIRSVPKMPPIMRPPTAQETYELNAFEGPGGTRMIKKPNGEFAVDPAYEARAELLKARQSLWDKKYTELEKLNEQESLDWTPEDIAARTTQAVRARNKAMDELWADKPEQPQRINPALETLWLTLMKNVDLGRPLKAGSKISEAQMLKAEQDFVLQAQSMGADPDEARQAFFTQWAFALQDGEDMYSDAVPPMSEETQRRAKAAGVDTLLKGNPYGIEDPTTDPARSSVSLDRYLAGLQKKLPKQLRSMIQNAKAKGATDEQIIQALKEEGF